MRVEVDEAGSQQEPPLRHGIRDEDLAAFLAGVDEPAVQIVQIVLHVRLDCSGAQVGRDVAEGGDAERGPVHLELRVRGQDLGQQSRHRDVVRDHRAVAAGPGLLQGQPHLERAEPA